jgi:hypothetical protein
MTQVSPDQTVAPATTTTEASAATDTTVVATTDPYDPTVTDTSVALNDPTLATPPSTTTFTSTTDTTTFGTISPSTGSTGGTSFTAPSTTGTGTTTTGTTSLGTLAGTTTTASGGGSTGSTATVTTPPPTTTPVTPTGQFLFSDPYTNGTTLLGQTGDDGLPLFGQLGASTFSSLPWGATGVPLGTVTTTGLTSPTYTLTGTGGTVVVPNAGGYDVIGNALQYDTTTTSVSGDTVVQTGVTIMHLTLSPTGQLSVDFVNPMGIFPEIQTTPWSFSITASDTTNSVTMPFVFQVQPMSLPAGLATQFGDEQGAGSIDNFVAQGPGNNLLFGAGGDDNLYTDSTTAPATGDNILLGGQGNDNLFWGGVGRAQLLGGDGNDVIAVAKASFLTDGFSQVDGGTGTDKLQLGFVGGAADTYDFQTTNNVFNIENIAIANPVTGFNIVKLDFKDVFEMTANDPTHTLNISNLSGGVSEIDVFGYATELLAASTFVYGDASGTHTQYSGTLASNNQTVTLIITQAPTADTVNIVLN